LQNIRFVLKRQLHRSIVGDAFMKPEPRLITKKRIEQTTIRVFRPELTIEEREFRMKLLHAAVADCYRSLMKEVERSE